ncbi:hypothetical protein H072_8719 [Dactylellina haptotyla CBS 200.50]|uniref:Peptidase M10 metallopeptidase domain-containing protein n=1 Tax=Dactylellina haptotyla (strain CBS 200.50) TaxID=1284197 RepID=S8A464_DACHA|nr:hypothetical protein H072_8719 [Dactylellina haptotyla CBS 200.50]
MEFTCGHGHGLGRRQATPDATRKWPQGFAFKWRLNGVIRGMDTAAMEAGISRALDKWAALGSFTFTKDASNPNVIITIVNRDGQQSAFNNKFTLGYSGVGPQTYGNLTGYVQLNDTSTGANRWNPANFHDLFLHEFGHVIGLGHAYDQEAIMAASVRPKGGQERPLTQTDISKYRQFYSGYPTGPSQNPTTTQPNNQYTQPTQTPATKYPTGNNNNSNTGYPTNPNNGSYQRPNNGSYQRPNNGSYQTPNNGSSQTPGTKNREICDNAHNQCTLSQYRKRLATIKPRQDYSYDPCRPEWEACMKKQGF